MIADLLTLAVDDPTGTYLFWGFVLFVVALAIGLLELVIPSGGLLSLLAGAAVIASIVAFFMVSSTAGVAALLTYLVLTPIAVVFGVKLWMNSPLAKMVVLGETVSTEEGPPPAQESGGPRAANLRGLVGAFGVTITPLRPVGTIKIEDRRLEALAENGTIESDVPVVVTDVYDNQVKVRPR